MALAALLFAHHTAAPDREPRAVERVAGLTVIERQIAQVRASGADKVLVAVEKMPPLLAGALERTGVVVVRTAQGFHVDPADHILVIEDGLFADARIVCAVAQGEAPAVAIWKGRTTDYEDAQRIDAGSHWAGVALYPGALVNETVAALGEWDLPATLLRAAFASGKPARIDATAIETYEPELRREEPMLWMRVRDQPTAAGASAALMRQMSWGGGAWPERYLYAPVERRLLPTLIGWPSARYFVNSGALVAALAAVAAFAFGYPLLGLLLGICASVAVRVADALDRQANRVGRLRPRVVLLFEAAAIVAVAGQLSHKSAGLSPWALAALILLASFGARQSASLFRRLAGRHLDDAGPVERRLSLVAGGRDVYLWTMTPFALAGVWYAGFVWLAGYAAITFVGVQLRFSKHLLDLAAANRGGSTVNSPATAPLFLSRRTRSGN